MRLSTGFPFFLQNYFRAVLAHHVIYSFHNSLGRSVHMISFNAQKLVRGMLGRLRFKNNHFAAVFLKSLSIFIIHIFCGTGSEQNIWFKSLNEIIRLFVDMTESDNMRQTTPRENPCPLLFRIPRAQWIILTFPGQLIIVKRNNQNIAPLKTLEQVLDMRIT